MDLRCLCLWTKFFSGINDEDEFSFIIKNKFNENHKNNINKMIRKENDLEYEYYFDFCYPSNGVFPNSNENDLW